MYFLARRPSCRHGCCCCCSWHRRRDVEGPWDTTGFDPRRPLPALAGPCQSLPVLASPCQPLPALASPYRVVRVFTATEGRSRRAPNENRPRSRSHPSIPRAEFLVLSHVRVPFTSHSLLELGPRAYPSAEAKLSLLIPNTKSSTTTCPRRKRIGRNDDGSGLLASRGVRIFGCAAVDTICFSHVWKHSLLVKKIQIQLIRDQADSKYVS